MKAISSLILFLFMALALSACSGDSKADSSADSQVTNQGTPAGTASSSGGETAVGEVAARVNDRPIGVLEVKKVARNFTMQGLQPDPTAQGDTHEAKLYYTALDRLIEQSLINQEVENRGVVITQEQVTQGMSQLKAMAGGEEAFLNVLTENGISMEDVERDTRTNLAVKEFYGSVVANQPTVPEEDIQAFYDENAAQWESQTEVHAQHILIRTQPGQTDMEKAEARRRATEVHALAKENPDFNAVAMEHSEDETTSPTGGDLSWFRRGRMVPAFDAAAFSLKAGEISDLVETQFGFHIIKVVETRMSDPVTLDQVRTNIQAQLAQQKSEMAFQNAVDDLKVSAKVDIMAPSTQTLSEIAGP